MPVKDIVGYNWLTKQMGKPPQRSWTIWGLAIWAGGAALIHALCPEAGDGSWAAGGAIDHGTCATLTMIVEKGGAVLAALGIRRKL